MFSQRKAVNPPAKPVQAAATLPTATQRRQITVNLKDGESLKGIFLGGAPLGIQISIANNTITLRWDDITQITFTDGVSPNSAPTIEPPPRIDEGVQGALRSLRKLAAAAEVGVNFQDYGRRVIDVKSEVEDFLARVSDGTTKNEIKLAMQAYVDAGSAWNEMIRYDFMLVQTDLGKRLQATYSIPVDSSLSSQVMHRTSVLSTIWAMARRHLENASAPITNSVVSTISSSTPSSESIQPPSNTNQGILEGRWSVTIFFGTKSASSVFSFTKVGDAYSASATSSDGTTAFTNITFDGKNLSFNASDKMDNQQVTIQGSGQVEGESISGLLRITTRAGQTAETRFAGNRLK